MMNALLNIFRITELRNRIAFTLAMLAVYRVGIFISVPGVDRVVMQKYVGSTGGLLGMFNLFSGGALEQLSIMALGIMPYISSSIILQLLAVVVPAIEKLKKEGEAGQKKITQYTRYGTILLAIIQGVAIATMLEGIQIDAGELVVPNPGWGFRAMTVLTLTGGTCFLMWLGEQITDRGIGNGISLLIFAGIVAGLPDAILSTWRMTTSTQQLDPFTLVLLVGFMVVVTGFIVYMERAQRRIPVQYAKRAVGQKMYGGQSTHLPLKVNTAGVIPPIFASSLLMFPQTLEGIFPWMSYVGEVFNLNTFTGNGLYVLMIVFFAFFYTAVTFNPVDVADNLKKYGGYIPGIRPGKKTAEYIDRVLSRITFGGSLYLAAVCVLPTLLINRYGVPFYFGGTSLLIIVGVGLDTVQQIESHLITRHYEGFTGPSGPRIRGRTRRAA
ncbi:MAG: preprotein translocase subunit SecY [Deltaproteobacteria bacterium]|nr:preprotein translocase subunit SecY [Deltaproteobacteria bacterium]